MSKKRASPSSASLSLNNNFKFTTPDSGFVYNGKNYSDWLFNITLACDGIPILRAMLRGEIERPKPTEIIHDPDVEALLARLKSSTQAFSSKPVAIYFDTSSQEYGTNANGGVYVTDWDPKIWDFTAAKAAYARAVEASQEEEGMSAEAKSALPPAPESRDDFFREAIARFIVTEQKEIFKARVAEYDCANFALYQFIVSTIRPSIDLPHIRSITSGSLAFSQLVSVFSGASGTKAGLITTLVELMATEMKSDDTYATLSDRAASTCSRIISHKIFKQPTFTKVDFLNLVTMGLLLGQLATDSRYSPIVSSLRLRDDISMAVMKEKLNEFEHAESLASKGGDSTMSVGKAVALAVNPSVNPGPPVQECYRWIRGTCVKGDSCRYAHLGEYIWP